MTGAPREAYAPRHFIIVSMAAVKALDGSWEAAGCFQRISWRAERDGYWRATMQEIADEIGVSVRTAKRITTKLREVGWVTADRDNTWESTLTWRPVFADESATVALPSDDEETAGQEPEGQSDPSGSANVAPSGVPPVAPSASAEVAPPQSANLASSPSSETAKTNNETGAEPLRDTAVGGDQPTLIVVDGGTDGASETRAIGTKDRDTLAREITTGWIAYYEGKYSPVTGSSRVFHSLRVSIADALKAGYSPDEIKIALARTNGPDKVPAASPDKQRFQAALVAVRTRSHDQHVNVHQMPVDHPDSARRAQAW